MRTKSLIFYSILDKLFKARKDEPNTVLHFSFVFWNTERKHKKLEVLKKYDVKPLQSILPQCNQQNYIYIYLYHKKWL